MQMKDALAGVFAVVDDESVPIVEMQRLGNMAPGEHHLPERGRIFLGGLADADDVLFRNHQNMRWRHGANIVERHDVLIFKCDIRGNFPRNDFAK